MKKSSALVGIVGQCSGLWCRAAGRSGAGRADVVRVGEGPFITGGGYFIAREKGYFKKLDIEIQTVNFRTAQWRCPRWSPASSKSPA